MEKEHIPLTSPYFTERELEVMQEVLDSGWVTQGPKVEMFEELFRTKHNSPFALATTSCTAALHLSLLALDIGPGDEVLVPAFTWVTTAHAVEYVGAKPIFIDVDLSTFNINPTLIEKYVTPNSKAIIVVHLFGKAADMKQILDISSKYDLAVVEDAACAVGTTIDEIPVGTFGDIGCFSFHPRKIITTGEGGMLTTKSVDLARKIKYLRNHGATPQEITSQKSTNHVMNSFDFLGFNLRLSDIQAAIGIAQMEKLEYLLEHRKKCAKFYLDRLEAEDRLVLPTLDPGHTFQSFVVLLRESDVKVRNRVIQELQQVGIETRPGTHSVPSLGFYQTKYRSDLHQVSQSIIAQDTSITLPIFPQMTQTEIDYVCSQLEASLSNSMKIDFL